MSVRATKVKNQKLKSKPIRQLWEITHNRLYHFRGKKRKFLTSFKSALNGFSPTATYVDLFGEYRNKSNVVFLVDPPYLSTDCTTYSRLDYWKLSDYLNVLKTIEDSSYFYFTSNKSQIIELCDWMETRGYCKNPFDGSTTLSVTTQLTHNAKYNDIMIYRNND